MEYIVDIPDRDLTDRKRLIRCKDCKTSVMTTRMNGMKMRNCPVLCMDVDDDFFCGGAKPKDGEQDDTQNQNT